jgi:hypothetical protein
MKAGLMNGERTTCLLKKNKLMKFNTSADILNDTDKCHMNFSCLYGERECLCEIEESLNNNIMFIKAGNGSSQCNHRISFGYSYICNCPVRKEIYKIYNV